MTLPRGSLFAGRFTILRLIGDGGMGLVYEVADTHFVDRRHALKTLRPDRVGDPRARDLFAREVIASARIESEHVVRVIQYDVTVAEPWMLMEYLRGEPLSQRVADRGPLSWKEARFRAREIGHALGAAHRSGVLHLDLKPANLFLARRDDVVGGKRLKVLDFGLSRTVMEGKSHVLQSRAMGTEAWMPPEQFSRRMELRPAADVWSYGLVLYWMLTGRHYWASIDAAGEVDDVMALLNEVHAGARAPASSRGMGDHLPQGFDAWFARCVAKDPDDRYEDINAASAALDAVFAVADTPEALPPPPPSVVLVEPPPPPPPPPVFAAPVYAAPVVTTTLAPRETPSHRPEPPTSTLKVGAWALAAAIVFWPIAIELVSCLPSPASQDTTSTSPAEAPSPPPRPTTPEPPSAPPTGDCPEGMAFVPVVSGGLCVDLFEVTTRRYAECVEVGRCTAAAAYVSAYGHRARYCNTSAEDHPINCVDWYQATAFCAWVGHPGGGRRLLTTAEWEVAATNASTTRYPWGQSQPNATLVNLCGAECARAGRAQGFPTRACVDGRTPTSRRRRGSLRGRRARARTAEHGRQRVGVGLRRAAASRRPTAWVGHRRPGACADPRRRLVEAPTSRQQAAPGRPSPRDRPLGRRGLPLRPRRDQRADGKPLARRPR
ncbi:MAG: bifunctional serine/threonine-protein kinase/formylglycine-generating enzyme family protein [Polyangiales bacterium]